MNAKDLAIVILGVGIIALAFEKCTAKAPVATARTTAKVVIPNNEWPELPHCRFIWIGECQYIFCATGSSASGLVPMGSGSGACYPKDAIVSDQPPP